MTLGKETELDSVGLLLIGHGSQLLYYKENLEKIAAIFRKRFIFGEVAISFMQRDSPSMVKVLNGLRRGTSQRSFLLLFFSCRGCPTQLMTFSS